jgi:glutaminyl-tRNA synthetase
MAENYEEKSNFIRAIIDKDLEEGKNDGRVHTRFPPEPSGYIHIGHAKAILLNYSIARDYKGKFNLRFDDTNPIKEEQEFVDSIIRDIKWLGADWEDRLFFTSDYFDVKFEFACRLIKAGRAYVCDLSADEIREYRGTLTEPGIESPYRNRSVEENLDLFMRMKNGEFPDGAKVLRAKIDMASGNLNMRDPVLYRILHAHHHRTGDKWCIYPMYDFDHPFSDAIEGITHSLCSLEFTDNRLLYDWIVDNALELYPEAIKGRPRQYEFARLNITHTVMSKRKLRRLVEEGFVQGWDDPRMPTIAGLRRRGVTPEAVADFCDRIGVARANSTVDVALFEHCIREDLNAKAPRVMGVLEPLKVVITNWPEDKVEWLEIENLPGNDAAGTHLAPLTREIYIEREDFLEEPPKKYHRLSPGKEVRLKGAYIIKCDDVSKDAFGQVVELRCSFDPDTKSGEDSSGKKVRGVIHWVSVQHGLPATIRIYDKLFINENPEDTEEDQDFTDNINPHSLEILQGYVEPAVEKFDRDTRFQFMRKGYFYPDPKESREGKLVFNQIVGLRDTWGKKNR